MINITPDISLSSLSANRAELLSRKTADSSAKELTPEQRSEYAKAARGFEAMFVEMMRKQMKDAMIGDEDDKEKEDSMSFGADTLEGYADMQFSDYVAHSGQGIGIAREIYKKLTGGEELATISQFAASKLDAAHPQATAANASANREASQNSKPELIKAIQQPINMPLTEMRQNEAINDRLQRLEPIISAAADRHNVPPELIRAVVRAESAGKHDAVSPVGAKGLMQLMDGTAAGLGVQNPFDPKQNIEGGAKYLRSMLDMFDGNMDLALAAYNAGPGNVRKHGGIPPFAETRQYVNRVKHYMKQELL